MLRVLELFAGIGACSKALTNLGVEREIVDAVEIDKYAVKSFNAVHGTNFEPQDITKWNKDIDVDLIMHGSPCFRAGELVNTEKGLTPIQKLKVGDVVLTAEGDYKTITKVFVSKSNDLMDIKPSCSHLINTTGNHPFYVFRNGAYKWVAARDLTTTDYLCVPRNTKSCSPKWGGATLNYANHNETSCKLPIEDERFWYLVGRFIGDGWVTTRKERGGNISGVKICCRKNGLDEFKEKISDVLHYCVVEDRTTYKLQFCNKELGEFCARFGIGATNKRIPQDVLDLDMRYLRPLYDGIMESGGSVVGDRHKLETTSKQLAYNMGELVLKLFSVPYQIHKTIRPQTTIIEGREVHQHDTYSTIWRLKSFSSRINFVDGKYLHSRVRRIKTLKDEDTVYNIEVEDEHTYCVNNVAVHNCQDYSVAGLQKGGDEGSGTRSSLMYETIRIVTKLKPKYVIWENVPNILSKKHYHNFHKYCAQMVSLGYANFMEVLNAKDYGIPQNRKRVFTVSIRNDLNQRFEFPPTQVLEKKLRNILEPEVDERYYLDDEKVSKIKLSTFHQAKTRIQEGDVSQTLCARDWKDPKCVRVRKTTHCDDSGNTEPKIIDPQGRKNKICTPSDHAPTLRAQTHGNQPLIVASRGRYNENGAVEQHFEPREDGLTNTLTTVQKDNYVAAGILVRKLTPKECWRLMGFDDGDFEKASKVCSNTQLYKQAGNSIVVDVLQSILKNLVGGENNG